ncbi:helix-turn-helix transcriptional regulator [Sinorhizobium medicae]|uniref:helix-turn-helix transcriptional regulator n=1 Tax=Sinorhizobium medicae TaxID=110321 RepID=UPI00299EFC80|nr:helix-turn-helix transcriptional regulator [Sinorhizobium medicae]
MERKNAVNRDIKLLRRLLRARDPIDAEPHRGWTVTQLAKVSGVSEAYFARSFRDAFGVPPHRSLLSWRVERAAALLSDTELPIIDIATTTRRNRDREADTGRSWGVCRLPAFAGRSGGRYEGGHLCRRRGDPAADGDWSFSKLD